MLSHKNKYILYLALLNGLLTAVFVCVWRTIFEDTRPMTGTVVAIAMFFAYELFVILLAESKSKTISSWQSINLFLGFKAGRMLLSLLFIAIYAIVVKVELKRFIMVFLVLYFIYLLFDTLYLISREKSLKAKQYKSKEIEN